MPPVDARSLVDSLEVPAFIDLDGVTHTGRLLSFVEANALRKAFREAADGGKERVELIPLICEAVGIPVEKIMAMPAGAGWVAAMGFFGAQFAEPSLSSSAPTTKSGSSES